MLCLCVLVKLFVARANEVENLLPLLMGRFLPSHALTLVLLGPEPNARLTPDQKLRLERAVYQSKRLNAAILTHANDFRAEVKGDV